MLSMETHKQALPFAIPAEGDGLEHPERLLAGDDLRAALARAIE